MDKYTIKAVHMDDDHSKIEKVKGTVQGIWGPTSFEHSKMDVILRISSKSAEYRTYKLVNGVEEEGPVVRVVNGKTGTYIRSDADSTEADNLGELPEY